MPGDLKIKVSAEVQEAVSGFKDVVAALKEINASIKALPNDIAKAVQALNGLNASTTNAANAFDKVADGAKDASVEVKKLGDTASSSGNKYAAILTQMNKVADASKDLKDNVNPAAEGVKNIADGANNAGAGLQAFATGAKDSAKASTSLSGIAKNLANNLFALINPEELLVVAITAAAVAIYEYATQLSFAEKAQRELASAIGEAQANTAGEVAQLKSLVAIASDVSLSTTARSQALQKLNEEYPDYFKNTSLDKVTLQDLTRITNELTVAIQLQAKAKAIQGQIDASASRVAAAQVSAQLGDAKDLLTTYDKVKIVAGSSLLDIVTGTTKKNIQTTAQNNYNKTIEDETKLQKYLSDQLTETNKQLANQGSLIGTPEQGNSALQAQKAFINKYTQQNKEARDKDLQNLEFNFQQVREKLIKEGRGTVEIEAAYKQAISDINAKYDRIESERREAEATRRQRQAEAALNKEIAAYNKQIAAIDDLRKQGVATKLTVQDEFALKIKKISLDYQKGTLTKSEFATFKAKLESDAADALKSDPFKVKISTINYILPEQQQESVKYDAPTVVIDTNKALTSAIDSGRGAAATIFTGFRRGFIIGQGAKAKQISDEFDTLLNSNILAGVESFAESLGNAFSGEGFGAVLKSVAGTIGGFIVDLGKLLVKSGLEIKVIQQAIKSLALTPAAAIIAGVAAIAIGTIIKNAANSSRKKFAEGGLVTGPTNALIGEAGPEVVFPLNKINQFISGVSGGGSNVDVNLAGQFRLSGGDLYLVVQAAEQRRRRGIR